jgi:hypothetical protein
MMMIKHKAHPTTNDIETNITPLFSSTQYMAQLGDGAEINKQQIQGGCLLPARSSREHAILVTNFLRY